MKNGIYKASFEAHSAGCGVIVFKDGKFAGGDSFFYYAGTIQEHDGKALAMIRLDRHTPGNVSFFGRDNLEVSMLGSSTDTSFELHGLDLSFSAIGTRLDDLHDAGLASG